MNLKDILAKITGLETRDAEKDKKISALQKENADIRAMVAKASAESEEDDEDEKDEEKAKKGAKSESEEDGEDEKDDSESEDESSDDEEDEDDEEDKPVAKAVAKILAENKVLRAQLASGSISKKVNAEVARLIASAGHRPVKTTRGEKADEAKTITRAEFDRMNSSQRDAHFKSGGKLVP